MDRKKVIIIGAAGRDFHNFNTLCRNNPEYEVVAFTATQIPDIDGRLYPAGLAGPHYPEGIPVYNEEGLEELIRAHNVDYCLFSYSDINYHQVMAIGARVNAAGAAFHLPGPRATMLKSSKPVVAIGAVRTGCGKSQTSRRVIEILMGMGLKVVAVRHPMPYGDLQSQTVQRFATLNDLAKHRCTIEEMEEYEPHVIRGNVIYAGVDYAAILRTAENDPAGCDVIVWDGGNNDFPFFEPDLMITVTDPHRPGHELLYYPGEITLRIANVVIINKIDSAKAEDVETVRANIRRVNPAAMIIDAASPVHVDNLDLIKGKRCLVVEDGPTLTHGGMKYGAGSVAALKWGAAEIVDPRPYAVGKLADTFARYPDTGAILPAMGYGPKQVSDLEATIAATPCDTVIIGTPIDLARVVKVSRPIVRVTYELQELSHPGLEEALGNIAGKIRC